MQNIKKNHGGRQIILTLQLNAPWKDSNNQVSDLYTSWFQHQRASQLRKTFNALRNYSKRIAKRIFFLDSKRGSPESSNMIMNLLATYVCYGERFSLGDDSLVALIQRVWHLYEEHGHWSSWNVDETSQTASGNPLTGNVMMDSVRSSRRDNLA